HHGVSVKRKKRRIVRRLVKELRVEIDITLRKIDLRRESVKVNTMTKSHKCLLEGILVEKRKPGKEQETREYEERKLIREFELQRLRAQLSNNLNENKLKAGNRINDLANVCILSENVPQD
ncbi:hypothetical protein TNCV_3322371, partial [Trichonephila clavipes]